MFTLPYVFGRLFSPLRTPHAFLALDGREIAILGLLELRLKKYCSPFYCPSPFLLPPSHSEILGEMLLINQRKVR